MATIELSQAGTANSSMKLRITYTNGNGKLTITKLEGKRDSYGPTTDHHANNRIHINIAGTTYTQTPASNTISFGKNSYIEFWSGSVSHNVEGSASVTITFTSGNNNGNIVNSKFMTSLDAGYSYATLTINNAGSTDTNRATISTSGLSFSVTVGNMSGRTGTLYLDGVNYGTKTGNNTWTQKLTSAQATAYINNNPNAAYGKFNITVSFTVGNLTTSKTLYVTIDSSIKPTTNSITVTSTPINSSLSALNNIAVKDLTIPTLTFSATGSYSSSIKSHTLTSFGGYTALPKTTTTNTITASKAYPTAGTYTPVGYSTDSRTRDSNSKNGTAVTVIDYNIPTVTWEINRCNSSGTLANEGTYAQLKVNYKFYPITSGNTDKNTKSVDYRIYNGSSWGNWTAVSLSAWSGTSTTTIGNGSFSINSSYKIQLRYADISKSTASSPEEKILPPAYTLISRRNGGKGITFGQIATEDGFNVCMAAKFQDKSGTLKTLLDLIYPVGSIYMSVNNVSPQDFFGGTWQRISQGCYLVGIQESNQWFDTVGSTGSNGNSGNWNHYHTTQGHALSVDELPKHTHTPKVWWAGYSGWDNQTTPAEYVLNWSSTVVKNTNGAAYTGYSTYKWQWQTSQTGGNASHTHGNTGLTTHVSPFYAVYIWKRTA